MSRLGKCRILSGKQHVLSRGHVREQGIVLEHHADIALVGLAQRQIMSAQLDDAAGRGLESRDHQQRGGLAGAAWPQEGYEFPALDSSIETSSTALVVPSYDLATSRRRR